MEKYYVATTSYYEGQRKKKTMLAQLRNFKAYYVKHQDCLTVRKVRRIDKYIKKIEE